MQAQCGIYTSTPLMVIQSTFTYMYLFSAKFNRSLSLRGTARFAHLNMPPTDRCELSVLNSKAAWVILDDRIGLWARAGVGFRIDL